MIPVGVLRLPSHDPALPLPDYATPGAAGLDISANLPDSRRGQGLAIAPGERALIPTGLALDIPEGYEIQLRPRSGLALRQGVTLVNAPGTIDSDYRGEVGVILINHGRDPVIIAHGMRIAQMVLAPVARLVWRPLDRLSTAARGEGGFGSTGLGARDGAG